MSLNKLKTSIVAGAFALSSACSVTTSTKENVDDCLNCDNTIETTEMQQTGIDRFVSEFNKNKREFKSVKEFWFFSINLAKKYLPEISDSFEKGWKDGDEYKKVTNYFFENDYFFDNIYHSFIKIEKNIDIKSDFSNLVLLFGDLDKLDYVKMGIVSSFKNKDILGRGDNGIGILAIDSFNNAYSNISNKWSYEDELKTVIANEASHSILYNYYNIHPVDFQIPIKSKYHLTYQTFHELISDAGSLCINGNRILDMLLNCLKNIDIKNDNFIIGEGVHPFFKKHYLYSNNFLFDLIKEIDSSGEILKIFKEQYKINQKYGKKHIDEDKDRIENAKKILSLLSDEDITNIRLAFINEGRKYLFLPKLETLSLEENRLKNLEMQKKIIRQ